MTLLELILALALSVLVMAAIGFAIQLHLRSLDTRRTQIEQAQLARAVLKMIADDLRSVVASSTVDFSEAARLVGGGIPGLEEAFYEDAFDEEMEDEFAELDDPQLPPPRDLSADLTPSTIPGIYGNQFQIQVDVSRLPRIEDFDVALRDAAGRLRDVPSDVKTVAYYLLDPFAAGPALPGSGGFGLGSAPSPTGTGSPLAAAEVPAGGLVRRALDRAATQWAVENGDLSRLFGSSELIAAEVAALEFRYFDGRQWHLVWDSEFHGGLPVAVEVALAIADESLDEQAMAALGTVSLFDLQLAPLDEAPWRVYYQVIRIPSAEPIFDAPEAILTDGY